MKWPSEMLHNLPYFWNTKTHLVIFHWMLLYFFPNDWMPWSMSIWTRALIRGKTTGPSQSAAALVYIFGLDKHDSFLRWLQFSQVRGLRSLWKTKLRESYSMIPIQDFPEANFPWYISLTTSFVLMCGSNSFPFDPLMVSQYFHASEKVFWSSTAK